MAYRAIAATEVDSESPIPQQLSQAWTDNLLAALDGASTAPKIQTAAYAALSVTVPKTEAGFIQGSYSGGAQTTTGGSAFYDYLEVIADAESKIHYVYIPAEATNLNMVGRIRATVGSQQTPDIRVNVNGVDGSIGVGSAIATFHVTAESSISVAALSGWVPVYVQFRGGANTEAVLSSVSWRIT